MKKSIVLKLTILTTFLCMLILGTIFIGQTVFFKLYYANEKVNETQASIESFKQDFLKANGDLPTIQKLEEKFFREHGTLITTLDSVGNIRSTNDFYITIQINRSKDKAFSNQVINIPLYTFTTLENMERDTFHLEKGNRVVIDGVKRDGKLVPAIISVIQENFVLENMQLSEQLYGKKVVEEDPPKAVSPMENTKRNKLYDRVQEDIVIQAPSPMNPSQIYLSGVIKELRLPMGAVRSNIYTNRVFLERIKQFQVNLLLHDTDDRYTEPLDYEENNIKYKLFINPIKEKTGETTYLFAMTSLQPVDEAVEMIEGYYVYVILFVLILSVLVSFYYSKKIAKPLLQINKSTSKIANLDFSERIPVTSKDEIGTLSQNINTLSNTLHSYIHQLQQDIEKEKKLEKTRKEFISGVSHELKTPLSILKSCISILEDGIAYDKREYYFKAMTKEVDKMDMLIVDMLELAKFESGTYKIEMEEFYIDQVIEYICEQLAMDITAKQLHVVKQLSSIQVVANQHRIEQVITNFITNAIRYTPEDNRIIISTIDENDRVKVCVENKGVHIDSEHLDKIWDRFYRGDASRQRSKGGTGLGLAISRNILELHGAQYGVSNTDDGVLFFFYLNKKR